MKRIGDLLKCDGASFTGPFSLELTEKHLHLDLARPCAGLKNRSERARMPAFATFARQTCGWHRRCLEQLAKARYR